MFSTCQHVCVFSGDCDCGYDRGCVHGCVRIEYTLMDTSAGASNFA